MSLKEQLIVEKLPKHIAIIMDGNGRWAKKKGNVRIFGHRNAVNSVRETAEACAELGISYLTLYAFSTENWNRPKIEVNALMELLISTINTEINTLLDNNIKLNAIGQLSDLPKKAQLKLAEAIEKTKNKTGLTLTLALSYSSKVEIVNAVKDIASLVKQGALQIDEINESILSNHLSTHAMPDPDLMIRTSGEQRISNFLLWQMAYTELYFTDVLWPDYNKEELYKAILDFQLRERRFGMISEQLENK
ncbi:MAG TPA: isoprenyl transferase [Marinilabiliales bacterium]|nr:MAG: di-trans,poly-cis-decaprenylcistransferase [Bacteroidetes bacterium GWC2_40_13]OFX73946.1 MAG: di-trans,poly-cis-decaprenylcistransferase [Bacteroidetes bacterium GWD2_40_43]OFX93220.1 MAG: di-trans,poly-cis-decaprenylcistransferase [Bacteroidetes bacterium GWE2_40_63]OFY21590.1 MAG: di-trans,poly-cis-decaprenylcistransferase [Bacteroidetes bacterium GWF2_40_13]OFZ24242.1 MAG: di-trans,poly-cis-decaprenylcistransferase [Bacteroidetes bacterium RIFOXYC2_FULL_40_12]HAM98007.1 isoprenyl t